MRRIAIIGSGQAGLLAAHGLVRAGHEVTLYSDRSADDWLTRSRPTGTAARFELALAYERELELNHWEAEAPRGGGVHLTFCPTTRNRLVTLAGRMGSYFQAIDLRLQSHRWMHDLEARGGRIVVEKIDPARLDVIAAAHELTLVASGRGPLAELFPRDPARSVYDRPQRKLAMIVVTGARLGFDGVPYLPVKFNFFEQHGEAFWVPYFHRDHGPTWCLLFEAKAGGPMDRFDNCDSGEAVVAVGKEVIRDLMPWDWPWARSMELADPMGWLVGGVAPTVREPVGRLPSGRVVMPLGDTAVSLDPIAGQGANHGNKMVRHVVAAVERRGDEAFDAAWMQQTFEEFWADHGAATVRFNNVFLEPLSPAGRLLLIAQYGSDGGSDTPAQRIADAVVENFVDPRRITDAFLDRDKARALVQLLTTRSWRSAFASGALRVGRQQLRRVVGLAQRHPLAEGS
jgi:2-polyprenyl-6-methoxyphenol hydroxylase-like FAD-dependent oxidoreductase